MKDMNRCDLLLIQYNFTFQDNMNRQLNCMISRSGDSAGTLAEELVLHGFIHTLDSSLIQVTSGRESGRAGLPKHVHYSLFSGSEGWQSIVK